VISGPRSKPLGLRVQFIVPDREGPSSRYRVLQYLPFLEKEGVQSIVSEYPRGLAARVALLWRLHRFDLVFLQKRLLRPLEWSLLKKRAARIVFDFDDAILYRDSRRGAHITQGRKRRFRRVVRGSHRVIAGNEYLRHLAEEAGARTVTIPTPVDMDRYEEKKGGGSPSVRIGWIGGAGTLFYLESLHAVLRDVCRGAPGTQVVVISDAFPRWTDVPMVRKPWSYEEEIRDLHSLDIGIMPLTDDPWARGKCGFKLLQYMAVGLPVVCSPVGVNVDMVRDGVQGFLARTPEEWAEHLRRLAARPELREGMGAAGRRLVLERYSLHVWAPRLVSALRETADTRS
jgi:hypothetical protein